MGSFPWSLYHSMSTGLSSGWEEVGVQSQGMAVFSPATATSLGDQPTLRDCYEDRTVSTSK